MCSRLKGNQESREHTFWRNTSDDLHAFSPVRQRQTPTPPPRVKISNEGTEQIVLVPKGKNENPAQDISRIQVKNPRKRSGIRRSKMNHTPNDVDTRVLFNGIRKKKRQNKRNVGKPKSSTSNAYEARKNKRRRNLREADSRYWHPRNAKCGHSQNMDYKDDVGCSSLCPKGSRTFRGMCALNNLQRLFKDFNAVEKIQKYGFSPRSKLARKVNSKLSKWSWLLDWLDGPKRRPRISRDKKPWRKKVKKSIMKEKRTRRNAVRKKTGTKRIKMRRRNRNNYSSEIFTPLIVHPKNYKTRKPVICKIK
ncbi:UNVERIFIED_CONTAM: hypothetical protein PYX00_008375 [Menopon gallinae]|uniref:Uncharacterized protein n=1 Tax=Menopon gallinae TaxID=328185 RepID=A0AAW2HMP5_9NEOP